MYDDINDNIINPSIILIENMEIKYNKDNIYATTALI